MQFILKGYNATLEAKPTGKKMPTLSVAVVVSIFKPLTEKKTAMLVHQIQYPASMT